MESQPTVRLNGSDFRLLGVEELTPETGRQQPEVEALLDPPPACSLRERCPRILNQGTLASCGAHAIVSALEFLHKNAKDEIRFSPMFVHYYSRERGGLDLSQDLGVTADECYMAIEEGGVCLEDLWPYDASMLAVRPSARARADAAKRAGLSSKQHTTLREIKWSIAEGYPVFLNFGIATSALDVGDQRSAAYLTGRFPVPSSDDPAVGSHFVLAVGYDDDEQVVIFQNSWGTEFGDRGFGKLSVPFTFGKMPSPSKLVSRLPSEMNRNNA